ncbi:hypothetical protein V1525DRAFT_422850 [Lipomyces kononenkoae]|uniref:Uncharacterized protein n=1 Tax=Lipomyces kononenkoae TaxID=34357 RepID=A0ACC3SQX7_LIPKO
MFQNSRLVKDKQQVAFAPLVENRSAQRCVCGSPKHQPSKCYYLNRPEGCEPRENIQKRVQEAVKNPETQKWVEQLGSPIIQAPSPQSPCTSTTTTTKPRRYSKVWLHIPVGDNDVILNSKVNVGNGNGWAHSLWEMED